jgi:tetratricopeptide (TPR) repeat protein
LFFYFDIVIVRKIFKVSFFFSKFSLGENVLIIILYFIPLAIFMFATTKGGVTRLAQENQFFNVDSPKNDTPEAAYRAALGYIDTGRLQDALKYLNISIKENNTILDAYLQRADINLSLGNYEEAAEDAETYIDTKVRGLDEKPYLILINAYASLKEWDNVFDVSKELLVKFPSNIQGIYYSAYSLKEQQETEKAIEVLSNIENVWEGLPEYLQKTERPFYKRAVKLLDELKSQEK